MGETRKKYTKEFKLEAIRLLESGTKPGHEIEQDLGIGSGQVYRWRKQFSEDGARAFPGNGKSRDEELAALRKEVKELREERDRNFEAAAADRVWVSDITYVATAEGWMYLCIVLDLYSRRVVGWSMSTAVSNELVLAAVAMAVIRRRPPRRLVFHSD